MDENAEDEEPLPDAEDGADVEDGDDPVTAAHDGPALLNLGAQGCGVHMYFELQSMFGICMARWVGIG